MIQEKTANELLYRGVREMVQEALGPVFKKLGGYTRDLGEFGPEAQAELLSLVLRSTSELVHDLKLRVIQKANQEAVQERNAFLGIQSE